ncbi:MAG: hypothetical protein ACXABY_06520 [Candidatus Thorarchaeota archaeon]|jgi:hypothetical protein
MEPAERADKILKEAREQYLVSGQLEKWLRNRIIEEIQKATTKKEVKKDVKS